MRQLQQLHSLPGPALSGVSSRKRLISMSILLVSKIGHGLNGVPSRPHHPDVFLSALLYELIRRHKSHMFFRFETILSVERNCLKSALNSTLFRVESTPTPVHSQRSAHLPLRRHDPLVLLPIA